MDVISFPSDSVSSASFLSLSLLRVFLHLMRWRRSELSLATLFSQLDVR